MLEHSLFCGFADLKLLGALITVLVNFAEEGVNHIVSSFGQNLDSTLLQIPNNDTHSFASGAELDDFEYLEIQDLQSVAAGGC